MNNRVEPLNQAMQVILGILLLHDAVKQMRGPQCIVRIYVYPPWIWWNYLFGETINLND